MEYELQIRSNVPLPGFKTIDRKKYIYAIRKQDKFKSEVLQNYAIPVHYDGVDYVVSKDKQFYHAGENLYTHLSNEVKVDIYQKAIETLKSHFLED